MGAFTDAYLVATEHNQTLRDEAPDYDAAVSTEQNESGDLLLVIDASDRYATLLEQAIAEWDTLDVRTCFAPYWSNQRSSWMSALEMVKYNVAYWRAIDRGDAESEDYALRVSDAAFRAAVFFARQANAVGMETVCDGDPQNMLDKMGVDVSVTFVD